MGDNNNCINETKMDEVHDGFIDFIFSPSLFLSPVVIPTDQIHLIESFIRVKVFFCEWVFPSLSALVKFTISSSPECVSFAVDFILA